jgi:hypothetical protein
MTTDGAGRLGAQAAARQEHCGPWRREDCPKSRRLNLIDEYQLVVHPVALGVGRPLFKDFSKRLELKLIEMAKLRAGAVFLQYQS